MVVTRSSAISGVLILALMAITIACKPWTVRPIEKKTDSASQSSVRFDARAFVESIWSTKVEPTARASAVDIATLTENSTGAPEKKNVLVKGEARVSEVNLRSRVGLAYLDSRPVGTRRIALQVGPVIRGTALRDALGFIRFGDFVNQIDFAAAATALNARALESALGTVDPQSLKGQTVAFVGATTLGDPGSPSAIEIVPMTLRVEAPAR